MDRDLACGLIGFAIALVYLLAAAAIPDSVSADSVGAAGVPHLLGYVLAGVSTLFVGQRLLVRRPAAAPAPEEPRGVFDDPRAAFLSATGTVAICAAFIMLFEPAGYITSVALLILALCLYQGVRLNLHLLLIAIGGAIALWILFAVLLSVRMPHDIWLGLF